MTKKNKKKTNTIDLTKASYKNIDEIDGVIKTLSAFDLINACDYIRANGVEYYDYEKDCDATVPLDMKKICEAAEAPEHVSLESVCADWFARLIGGVKHGQAYKDFVYWYNVHKGILEHEVSEGKSPTIPFCDIKYLALKKTVNSMCEAIMID